MTEWGDSFAPAPAAIDEDAAERYRKLVRQADLTRDRMPMLQGREREAAEFELATLIDAVDKARFGLSDGASLERLAREAANDPERGLDAYLDALGKRRLWNHVVDVVVSEMKRLAMLSATRNRGERLNALADRHTEALEALERCRHA